MKSARLRSFFIELTDVLLRVSKKEDRNIAPSLVDLPTNKSLEINISKRSIKSPTECDSVIARNKMEAHE